MSDWRQVCICLFKRESVSDKGERGIAFLKGARLICIMDKTGDNSIVPYTYTLVPDAGSLTVELL